ncbi:integrase arm-type DNA-binding domain-containing protein [uncultured Azohydromonas sp.]|uniref:tyrosine-type recombinase/integrase n=1 Tax=uncultured Azohydromonas sp. TaxID=487342 RepID=UPI00262827BC|nr:integrase arm-type DNA-binding domain-containing protein [uncultured Azohydromonas sp.]
MPLTDTAIRAAKPSTKPVRLFDGEGLYLEVSPNGGKWWRLKYRHGGKEKRLSLGTYPDTGLKAARERRDEARRLLADGIDPSAARQAEKARAKAATEHHFKAVALAWLQHRAAAWRERTVEMHRSSFERDVFPKIGARQINEILPADVRQIVQAVEARGAGEAAIRIFQRLRAVFRYAVAHELVAADPTYPLKPSEIFKPRRVTHRAAMPAKELPTFLTQLDAYQGQPGTCEALRLLLLTAVRPEEQREARWAEFDLEHALWRIPAERMKMGREHLVPLSLQAVAVIERMRPLSGAGELVFPSPFYPGKPLSENTLNSALARMGYKGAHTAHGFRSVFSTAANEGGWNPDVIERHLAHLERNQVRGAYNRAQHLEDRRELMQAWADYLDAIRQRGKVFPFKPQSSMRARATLGQFEQPAA